MKKPGILAEEACYLRAVIDAADHLDNEDSGAGDVHLRNMVTSLIHVAAKLAKELEFDLGRLAG